MRPEGGSRSGSKTKELCLDRSDESASVPFEANLVMGKLCSLDVPRQMGHTSLKMTNHYYLPLFKKGKHGLR
jgi:hypothetical protein